MPYFSVIIPLYNKENNIAATIESVLLQSFQDFEIIIVNDGSTDNSESKVLSLLNDKIKYFKTENRGVSQARNFAIEKSEGKILAFLDADDYWYVNHLEHLKLLRENFPEAGLLATNYEFYFSEKRILKPSFLGISSDFDMGIVEDFFHSSYEYRLAWTSAVAVPKNVLEEVGNFDENITLGAGEDSDLWIRIAIKYPVAFINKVSSRYKMDGVNRISHSNTLRRKFSKLDKFYLNEKVNPSLKKFLDLYRTEYALKHKLAGDRDKFMFYKKDISREHLNLKTKILFSLPSWLLRLLYKLKKLLGIAGIDLTVYH